MQATRRHWQTTTSLAQEMLSLPVSGTTTIPTQNGRKLVASPYFQTIDTRRIGTGRDTHLSLVLMKAFVGLNYTIVSGHSYVSTAFLNGNTWVVTDDVPFDITGVDTEDELKTAITAGVNTYASNHSYTLSEGIIFIPSSILAGIPQAAIADAPADAVTNYNVVTTLLGTLTGAVNTANTKQNEIATKLNTLFAELRSAGIIST